MNWSELYRMQKELDSYIEEEHSLSDQDLFKEKHLAMLVELGELANETRCFKFWSNKPQSDKETVLEEYVDGLHFLLSLGLEKKLVFDGYTKPSGDMDITEQFNNVYLSCTSFYQKPTEDYYIQLFNQFLHLGNLLGFSHEEIMDAYLKKNRKNYQRQNEGY